MLSSDKFLNYLNTLDVPGKVIPYDEMTEVIVWGYQLIRRAVLDQGNILKIDKKSVSWYKKDQRVGQLNVSISFLDAFEAIHHHDEVVREHLKQTTKTDDQTIYEFIFSENHKL